MKVHTDGVLLGAWAAISASKLILDIGTGTGVIALQLAQRNEQAMIDAIDIDEAACAQASENFAQSNWHSRLRVMHTSLQQMQEDKKYDAMVSNPPYFINDLKANSPTKNVAKHGVALSYQELLIGINRLLTARGKAFIAIPQFNLSVIANIARQQQLYITQRAEVIAVSGKSPYLALVQLERTEKEVPVSVIQIQDEQGNYTPQYKQLTKDFYLKF